MGLPNFVAGAIRPPIVITWTRADGTAEDLTGATLTGTLTPKGGSTRAIAGSLDLTTATSGIFTWTLDAADVVAGEYLVQFNAAFASGTTPARTFATTWTVEAYNSV